MSDVNFPWWQQQQSTQNSSPSSSHKFQASATTTTAAIPHQQSSSWPSRHRQQQQQRLWLNEQEKMKNINANQEQGGEPPKDPMFEKLLTTSDVGKLNRLVIPKQCAERYFPLGGGRGGDPSSERGLLLSFEDESGKCWRFRYSYWNSSQSYVLTKGWTRYVKEKKLNVGDVIQFERHRIESDRLFISWRRRGAPAAASHPSALNNAGAASSEWPNPVQTHAVTVPLYRHAAAAAGGEQGETTSVGNSRTLRLFGVNLEYQGDDDESESEAQQQQFIKKSNYSVELEAAHASTNRHDDMAGHFNYY